MADKNPKQGMQLDVLVAVAIIVVILMLIIPLPDIMLDIFLSFSLMGGIIVLLSVLYIKKTTDFTVFPSLLLITTVFRLALNVSTTRLILLKGPSFDVKIIKAFGDFVVGDSLGIAVKLQLSPQPLREHAKTEYLTERTRYIKG